MSNFNHFQINSFFDFTLSGFCYKFSVNCMVKRVSMHIYISHYIVNCIK